MKTKLIILFMVLLALPAFAQLPIEISSPETLLADSAPIKPVMPANLKAEIDKLKTIPPNEALNKLKKDTLLNNNDLLTEAVSSTFNGREIDAIYQAINVIRSPRIDNIDGKVVNRSDDYIVAKKVIESFPDQSIKVLQNEYNNGNAALKINILQIVGGLKNEKVADDMLIAALNDTSFTDEEVSDETGGEPMRVCDMAYNQLVLRYEIMGVLRTIAPMHKIDVRNYHIGILRNKLSL